ncbi:MAG: hypothetical protein ABI459_08300 [Deltaproteobacteria bacterium]
MSDNDSFIDEVTEELRRDQLFAAFRKYGWIAVLGVLLLVGGAAYREWSKARTENRAETYGDALLEALKTPDDARSAALGAIETQGAGEAAVLALVKSGSGDASALKAVQATNGLDPIYKDLASLKLLMLNPDGLDATALKAGYEQLAFPGAPFRLLAMEQMALLDVSADKTDDALATFQRIYEDSEVTPGLKARAQGLITTLGGEVQG